MLLLWGGGWEVLGLKEISHQPSQPKMAAGFSEYKSRGADPKIQHSSLRLGIKTHSSKQKEMKSGPLCS